MTDHANRRICAKRTAIYTIILNDDTGRVYGGKTIDPAGRLVGHRKNWPNAELVVARWLAPGDDWVTAEREHVASLIANGHVLANKNAGGGGPAYLTDDQRLRLSKTNTGKRYTSRSATSRAKTSNSLIAHVHADNTKALIGVTSAGRMQDDATRAKRSMSLRIRAIACGDLPLRLVIPALRAAGYFGPFNRKIRELNATLAEMSSS